MLLGQGAVFREASILLERLSGIDLSDKQIENLCHHYGAVLEDIDNQEDVVAKDKELTYTMVDGSYIMTRTDGWKEVKLGRIFKANDHYALSEKRKEIGTSHYVSHLGESTDFLEKLSANISHLDNMVCIADGAPWFWNWLHDNRPEAVQILDFYHGYEKLCQWSLSRFKDKAERDHLNARCKALLLDNQVQTVLSFVENTDCKGDSLEKQQTLITYFTNNAHRMAYKTYREKGYLIGSGAMESAHRNVIQHRLKRSGQRWTQAGGQQVLNLRTTYLSKQWGQVTTIVRAAA